MKLKVNKTINIIECTTKKQRFKTFKFFLNPIDFGLYIPKKKLANTYFFCQRIDICFVNKDNIIIGLYENVKSEKLIYKRKAKGIYFLPLGTCQYLKIGKEIPIVKEKE